jgi:hypothetical protein
MPRQPGRSEPLLWSAVDEVFRPQPAYAPAARQVSDILLVRYPQPDPGLFQLIQPYQQHDAACAAPVKPGPG